MIKLSKKTALFLMIFMCIFFLLTLRNIDWKVIDSGEGVYKEISLPLANLQMTIYFFLYYVKKMKEENK